MNLGNVTQVDRSRAVAALLAVSIQGLIALPFVGHLVTLREGPRSPEMTIALERASDPRIPFEPAEPTLLQPESRGDVAPPAVEITDATLDQDLPPRPDPAHPNVQPLVATTATYHASSISGGGRAIIVVLRAFVREDGMIADIALVGSCGVPALDDLAATFVKAHWKFLPAMENGHPVAKWTSLEVVVAS